MRLRPLRALVRRWRSFPYIYHRIASKMRRVGRGFRSARLTKPDSVISVKEGMPRIAKRGSLSWGLTERAFVCVLCWVLFVELSASCLLSAALADDRASGDGFPAFLPLRSSMSGVRRIGAAVTSFMNFR